jgi:hypothetical protein
MTSKIKVDNINKVSDDSNIINKCGTTVTVGAASDGVRTGANNLQASDGGNLISQSGTTITLGASGDTITLASGASQTGFGRTGTVDWQTSSIKTSTFTAADGEGYFVNSGSALTMNLPAGSAGAIVAVSDYARNFATYNLTISPNGSEKIGGVADTLILDVDGQSTTLVYVDSTKGWINIQNAEDTQTGETPAFVAASGGTVTTVCTNFKVHTFTSPGTFTVSCAGNSAGSNTVSYVVVGAGGGGGGSSNANISGGGGAGGYREGLGINDSYTGSPLRAPTGVPVTASAFPITIGAGGGGGPQGSGCSSRGTNGADSVFSTITSAGGGGGGNGSGGAPTRIGRDGGSGGGGAGGGPTACGGSPGGSGNTPPVSPPQGNNGGTGGLFSPDQNAAGGGGAGAVGQDAQPPATSGAGGAGLASSITGSSVTRAGGGGGAEGPGKTGGAGGPGGGGAGSSSYPGGGTNGTVNTGGGGGGSGCSSGAQGGSGIVVIRYRFQ